jgi:dihydrofolate reductase
MEIVLVAAIGENRVIGRDNGLPWRLKSDLKHFRAATMGHPILMGRRTYLSVGRPLPGRTNIVISRDPGFAAPGIVVAPSLAAALETARGDALRRGANAIMVTGGAGLFAETMSTADRLEITRVHLSPDGDTFFPEIDPQMWREAARVAHPAGPEDDAAFDVISYVRTARP